MSSTNRVKIRIYRGKSGANLILNQVALDAFEDLYGLFCDLFSTWFKIENLQRYPFIVAQIFQSLECFYVFGNGVAGSEVCAVHLLDVDMLDILEVFCDDDIEGFGFVDGVVEVEHCLDVGMVNLFDDFKSFCRNIDDVSLAGIERFDAYNDVPFFCVVCDGG